MVFHLQSLSLPTHPVHHCHSHLLKVQPWSILFRAQSLAVSSMSEVPTLCRRGFMLSELRPKHLDHSWGDPWAFPPKSPSFSSQLSKSPLPFQVQIKSHLLLQMSEFLRLEMTPPSALISLHSRAWITAFCTCHLYRACSIHLDPPVPCTQPCTRKAPGGWRERFMTQ